ncbi:MAG: hypothetical protein QOE92_847 [Chloroflexota bacterium]|jgi:hypothetical protein|nr:hypothetical protein [Chloroflexota bacterium]
MRFRLLRVAEVLAWMAAAFAAFLAFRVFFIFLSIINPAWCDISCELARTPVPVGLSVFVVGWAPFAVIGFIRYSRHHAHLWWLPHVAIITATHAVAMGYVAQLALGFRTVDDRNVVLAGGAGVALLLATGLLFAAVLLDRNLPEREAEIRFFQEDAGD